jgi:hypothetical protein
MIEYQVDSFDLEYWKTTRNIYVMPSTPDVRFAHEIFLAKNADYLVYKLASEDRVYTMAVCDWQHIFDSTTF